MKVLRIDSSPRGERSFSRRLTQHYADSLTSGEVIHRDLIESEIPYVTEDWIIGVWAPTEFQTDSSRAAMAFADSLIAEFQSVDHLLIGAPMYNFGSPAVLKSYFDQIIQMGKLVKMEDGNFIGLAKPKSATVITSRGARYTQGSGAEAFDHQVGHLRTILGFIGVNHVEFIHCEGLAGNEENQTDSFEAAKRKVAESALALI